MAFAPRLHLFFIFELPRRRKQRRGKGSANLIILPLLWYLLTLFDTLLHFNYMNIINPYEVYTTTETQKLLKVSDSTIKRLLKNGLLRANKVGGQYRILGKEILRMVSPELEKEATKSYLGLKKKVVRKINTW